MCLVNNVVGGGGKGKWTGVGSSSRPRFGAQSIFMDETAVVVIGGYDGRAVLSACEMYLKSTRLFYPFPALVLPRYSLAATAVYDRGGSGDMATIYVFGGESPAGSGTTASSSASSAAASSFATPAASSNLRLDSYEVYEKSKKEWTLGRARMNSARSGHSCCYLPYLHKIIIIGGLDNSNTALASTEFFDLSTQQFEPGPSLHMRRSGHTATLAAGGRTLFVIGGMEKYTNVLNTVEMLDVSGRSGVGEWVTGSIPPMRSRRTEHSATLVGDDRIMVVGGRERMVFFKSCEIYDVTRNQWMPAPDLPFPRAQHCHSFFYS
jgi:hypothetical protein